jgi:hypothetical protein
MDWASSVEAVETNRSGRSQGRMPLFMMVVLISKVLKG